MEPAWEDITSQENADVSVTGNGKVKFEMGENGGDIRLQAEVKENKTGMSEISEMNQSTPKPTEWHECPTKIQISLPILTV